MLKQKPSKGKLKQQHLESNITKLNGSEGYMGESNITDSESEGGESESESERGSVIERSHIVEEMEEEVEEHGSVVNRKELERRETENEGSRREKSHSETRLTEEEERKIKQEKMIQEDSEHDENEEEENEDDIELLQDENYQLLLSTYLVLKDQLDQARKDIQTLLQQKQVAMTEPISFIQNIVTKKGPKPPKPQQIPEIPQLDFSPILHNRPKTRSSSQLNFQINNSLLPSPNIKPSLNQNSYFSNVFSRPFSPNKFQNGFSSAPSSANPSPNEKGSQKKNSEKQRSKSNSNPNSQNHSPFSHPSSTNSGSRQNSKLVRSLSTPFEQKNFWGSSPSPPSSPSSTRSSSPPFSYHNGTDHKKKKKKTSHSNSSSLQSTPTSNLKTNFNSNITHNSNDSFKVKSEFKTNNSENDNLRPGMLVRGRIYDDTKPKTFNMPWSEGEKAKLEELLNTFPDEEIQARRFAKISAALGTRTPRQVASRIQKYFIKLAKEGKPIPGKMNFKYEEYSQYTRPDGKRKRKLIQKKSDDPTKSEDFSDDETRNREAIVSKANDVTHLGYKCDGCGMEPIVGIRWRCLTCMDMEIDLCEKCFNTGFYKDGHTPSHHFEKIQNAETPYYVDEDYAELMGEYSYLDPNYNP